LETGVQGGNGAVVFGLSRYGWRREVKGNGVEAKIPKQGRATTLAGSLWGEIERGDGRWVSWVSWEKETVLGRKWGNGVGRQLVWKRKMCGGRACVGMERLVLRRGSLSCGRLEKKIQTRGGGCLVKDRLRFRGFFFSKLPPLCVCVGNSYL
jgi:hypothetical protein